LAKKIAAKFGENKTTTKYGYKFGGKIWRENLAGKFGGKSWQRIGRKLAGNFKIWRENLAKNSQKNWREILKFGGKIKEMAGKFISNHFHFL